MDESPAQEPTATQVWPAPANEYQIHLSMFPCTMYSVHFAYCSMHIDAATWCWLWVSRSWGHRNWWGSCRKLFSCYRYCCCFCCCCYCCFLALLFFLVIVVVVVVVVISMKPVAGGIVGWGGVGKTITEPPIEMSAQALMMATMMLLSLCLN